MIDRLLDLGTVLSLSNATSAIPASLGGGTYPVLGTSYNTGTSPNQFGVFQAASSEALAIIVAAQFANGTSVTNEYVKLQGTRDGTNWFDLQTTRQDSGVTQAEHAIAAVAGTTQYVAIETTSHWMASLKGLRVIGKVSGTAGAGDSISVAAVVTL